MWHTVTTLKNNEVVIARGEGFDQHFRLDAESQARHDMRWKMLQANENVGRIADNPEPGDTVTTTSHYTKD